MKLFDQFTAATEFKKLRDIPGRTDGKRLTPMSYEKLARNVSGLVKISMAPYMVADLSSSRLCDNITKN